MLIISTGITIAKTIDKMGMLSSDTAQIFFEDVTIPADYVIGEEGQGFTYQMIQFQEERMYATSAGKGVTCSQLTWMWGGGGCGWGSEGFMHIPDDTVSEVENLRYLCW